MRRISRIDRSIGVLRKCATANPQYICSACHHQASSFSTTTFRTDRTNKKVPLTEKVRQRIWGTDQPPGLKDPYGDASVFDQTKKRGDEELEEEGERPGEREGESGGEVALSSDVSPDHSGYEPASIADGLEEVGGWEDNWDLDNRFQGFLPAKRVTDDEDIAKALHRALVEVFALKQAGKLLSEISSAQPGVDQTMEVQVTPSDSGASLNFMGTASLENIVQSLASVDETSAKGNPTESEEGVAADRSTVDPLGDGSLDAPVDETATKESPIESQPLSTHHDPEWHDVSLEDPEIKFAVWYFPLSHV